MGDPGAATPGATVADRYGNTDFHSARQQARRPDELAAAYAAWVSARRPDLGPLRVAGVELPSGGASSDLYVIALAGSTPDGRETTFRSVVRLEPSYHVYPVVDLGRQFRAIDAAARFGPASVPAALWHEPDPSVLGAPFLVTEHRPGSAPPGLAEGWLAELTPAERERLWCASLDALAALHATDIAAAGIADLVLPAGGETPLDRYLRWWRRYVDFASGDAHVELPVLEHALAVLEASRPAAALPESFVWGDARIGNILYEGTTPTALVDFEFAHVGLREFDVAFFSFFDKVLSEYMAGVPRLDGFLGHDETFDYYESVSGVTIGDRAYFTLMASTYNTVAVTRVLHGRAVQGFVPPEMVRTHGPMCALADLLGVARPV